MISFGLESQIHYIGRCHAIVGQNMQLLWQRTDFDFTVVIPEIIFDFLREICVFYKLVSLLVGALSPVSHKGLHQG